MRRWAHRLGAWGGSLTLTLTSLVVPGSVAAAPSGGEQEMGRLLQEELRAHGADVHGCYASALAARPGLSGEVLVRIHVASDGGVVQAEVLKDQVNSGRLTDCLTGAMQHWKVPRLAGEGTQQIVFPLVFKPEDVAGGPRYVVPLSDGKPGALPGGKITARVLVDAANVGPTGASLTRLGLSPSTRLALHKHPGAIEILYVVKGRAHLRDGFGDPLEAAETGDVVIHRAGVGHSVEAAPLAPLDLIQIFIGPGPEHAYLDPKRREGTLAIKKTARPADEETARREAPEIVKAAAQKPLQILAGQGAVTLLLDGKLKEAAVERFEAEAGAEVKLHKHDLADEILYVLSGKAEMTVAGKPFAIAAGDAIHIPKTTPHSLAVTEKLVALQVYAPAGPEQRFKSPPAPAATSPVAAPPRKP